MPVPDVLFALTLAFQLQDVRIPPPPQGFAADRADMVVDQAAVLSPEQTARINRLIFAVKSRSGGEIAIVTMPDIGGVEAADVALRIGREWRVGEAAAVGDRARNAGVVVLVVPKETASDGRGQISIMTGQGAEGFITDGTAGDIRREAVPYFQRQDYGTALELITTRLSQRYAAEFGFALDSALLDPRFMGRQGGELPGAPPQFLFALFLIVFFLLVALANARSRGGRRGCLYLLAAEAMSSGRRGGGHIHWGGGGFGGGGGGGFGGFGGGGGFSGGGSSGSW